MATPETRFKQRIKREMAKVLDRYTSRTLKLPPVWYRFNAGTAYGGGDRLDFDGVVAGKPFYGEIKAPDGSYRLTTRQKVTIAELAHAGAAVFIVDSEESLQVFLTWLQETLGEGPQ